MGGVRLRSCKVPLLHLHTIKNRDGGRRSGKGEIRARGEIRRGTKFDVGGGHHREVR